MNIALSKKYGMVIIIKIYDCFTFFNEFELLELRLNLLNNVVDYFVLVESNKTFKNENKEYYFEKNQDKFKDYLDKIIHIKVNDMPDYDPDDEWRLEVYQRNCIMRGLNNTSPDDIVLISDVDEIPKPNILELLNKNKSDIIFASRNRVQHNIVQVIKFLPDSLFKSHGIKLLDRTPLALEQDLFYYFVNCRSKGKWSGTVITKAKNLSTPQQLRHRRSKFPRIKNSGWHFSYLGGVNKIVLKLNSIITETNVDAYSGEYINNCIANGLDIYGREGSEFEYEFIDIDEVEPAQMQDLVQKYSYLYFDYQKRED
ncbi:beta-1,4-mannosyl-glycoprotein beta-1,4-N-acetylglucosaminyltransferase [Anaerospora hongkongensis]|uniref:Beta-1,4-mannosyl-glycoprotein beta-1,4-N-acetylglucosaminyltransferase n=1 Tax=Anaerospora hongkongensis TaxID=244830 RepID=A0A4R1PWP5_9FIRM|nr:hypothetical protein [Anaerospora hongkongensis]TCL36078.1 beta-1,4-mannosyl-glycoprotein beta-1,4-N-acetylglucosaminyltransferase [Anaerospora hongkongensis]